MNLLVCISKTPETTAEIRFNNDNTAFDYGSVNTIMNPYDEWYALVRAIELKEQAGGNVTVINVGPASNDTIIRKALAIGADQAVRIDTEPASAMSAAKQIAAYAKDKNYDIIFLGKETIDYNGSEIGGMIAEMLDMPYVSYANHLAIDGQTASVSREIEGGSEVAKVSLPLVLSAAKGLAEQRIPNMRGIMMAKRKPLEVVSAVDAEDPTSIRSYALPEEKGAVTLIDPENMEELVRKLHEEAKII